LLQKESFQKEKEAWRSFFRWFIAMGITVLCFWSLTLQLLLSPHSPVLIYPFYALVLMVSFFFFGNLIGSLVVVFLSTLLGVFAFSFLTFREGVILFLEVVFLWLVLWGIIRFIERQERQFQRDELLLDDLEESLNALKVEHEKDSLSRKSLQERIEKYKRLAQITRTLSSSLDFKQTSYFITTLSRELLGKGEVRFLTRTESLNCFEQWIFERHTPLLVKDIVEDFRFEKLSAPPGIRSLIGVPLIQEGKVLALLSLESSHPNLFTEDDLRLLSLMADISSIAWKNAQLFRQKQELTITDELTGLYLQNFFKERLTEEIGRARRFSTDLSLLMIDLDWFKRYNDRYGHQAGDEIISVLAGIFRDNTRETDLVARYGGEEFAILMPRTSYSDAYTCAEKIRQSVEKRSFNFENQRFNITVSVGVAAHVPGIDANRLISLADEALYRAKQEGRNRVA